MRRLFDISFTIILSPMILFLCIISSILIKFESPGPIFFCSQRVGKNGDIFTIYKLRTMKINTPLLPTSDSNASNYVTRTGRLLRSFSIDELPQFLNILNGSMTLIGPRPCLKSQDRLIKKRKDFGIFTMKPGLTGLAQIKGRDSLSTKNKIRYENFYLLNQSLKLDLYIFVMSFINVFKTKNVNH